MMGWELLKLYAYQFSMVITIFTFICGQRIAKLTDLPEPVRFC